MGLLINEKYYSFASDMVVTMAGNWEKTLEMFKKKILWLIFFFKAEHAELCAWHPLAGKPRHGVPKGDVT